MARRKAPAPPPPAWPVEWYRFKLGTSEWRVLLSTPEHSPQLVDAEGYCQQSKSTIWLDATLPADRLADVAFHEKLHAVLFHFGIAKAQRWDDDAEERFISHLAPNLTAALASAGLLAMPPLPALPGAA